ncbi:hypothetical protein GCM10010331_49360 [Streptomyces xanthochromogenes]|uniref:hypothetical protein n=1 Tax=Streptomyces xanthochromogenes TaxID=67384 RepID=UPI001671C3AB|nr:hypothetical protein [Streptomyces xanthochromogenes]GHB55645.1 hypothetical protein GCM10010331_49360 [Streptomyces xanthochromogenes]
MATPTLAKPELTNQTPQPAQGGLRGRIDQLHNPGLYVGAGLGVASGYLTGDPLLLTTIGATGVAAGWTALGMHPGPWRWLPGQGEPWEWLCRSSSRGYRRKVRRMRNRLTVDNSYSPAVGSNGLLVPVIGIADGWRQHDDRAALVRAATAEAHRARCAFLRKAWAQRLPNWGSGWWRTYSFTEMALRAGPLTAIPAAGFVELPWWAHLTVASAGAAWGSRMWRRPEPAAAAKTDAPQGVDWYLARWAEWIACDRGPLPGSKLASLSLDDDKLTAVIVSSTAKAALAVDEDSVSIAFEVPPRAVNVYRPDDMAANRAKLTVRLKPLVARAGDELPDIWQEYNPYEGSELHGVEETDTGRKFTLLLPRKGTPVTAVQARTIAQALDMPGEEAVSRLHLRAMDARRIEVNEMSSNPLQDGVPLDLDALRMDADGYVSVGVDIYGRPARWRLMIPNAGKFGLSGTPGMSAVHSFDSGTTGAGKTSLEEALLIAQAVNGFVSWVADGKGGVGYASWTDDLDWLVKSPLGFALLAQGASDVGKHRFAVQMRMQWRDADGDLETGRSFFVPGEPFAPMSVTFDEFNEMAKEGSRDPNSAAVLKGASHLGRQTRAAGIGARAHVQLPNLDAIGSNADANAVRDMFQSGNIALFRTARADVDSMSLGSRTPEFRLEPIPEKFPNGAGTGGLCYIADGSAQYTQSRVMYHHNAVKVFRQLPRITLTDSEAEAAGVAYLRRDEYRHLDAADEDAFLRELVATEQEKTGKNKTVVDLKPAPVVPAVVEVEDDDLDDLVPPTRSQLVWHAVDGGARRNKQIAEVTDLKPANVANATARLERLGKLTQRNRDWHTAQPIDA